MIIEVSSANEMKRLGEKIGRLLQGGETIELVGDVGAGKTTLTKGLAVGLGVDDTVQSPSFTISQNYKARDGLYLSHYDFYRLNDAGIMAAELAEVTNDPLAIVVIEWADTVKDVLSESRWKIEITAISEDGRRVVLPNELEGAL